MGLWSIACGSIRSRLSLNLCWATPASRRRRSVVESLALILSNVDVPPISTRVSMRSFSFGLMMCWKRAPLMMQCFLADSWTILKKYSLSSFPSTAGYSQPTFKCGLMAFAQPSICSFSHELICFSDMVFTSDFENGFIMISPF